MKQKHRSQTRLGGRTSRHHRPPPAAQPGALNVLLGGMAALFITLLSAFYLLGKVGLIQEKSASPEQFPSAPINVLDYCRNGVYYLPTTDGGEISCGRAPGCNGMTYEEAEKIPMPQVNRSYHQCWFRPEDPCAANAVCGGALPLCCYLLAETGDPEKCVWNERYFCHPNQCASIPGDKKSCGYHVNEYCVKRDKCYANNKDMPLISLEERLGMGAPASSPTPTTNNLPPTTPPTPTTNNLPPTTPPTPTTNSPPPTTVPSATPTRQPTLTPKFQLTPQPIVRHVEVTIPVMAIKLGQPTEGQSFVQWITGFFRIILPGRQSTPTPTPPDPTATPVSGGPTATPVSGGPTATPDPNAPPTATPDPATPPTNTPVPTATPVPLPCPGTSSYCPYGAPDCFVTLNEMKGFYPAGDPPPSQHPDLNLSIRGYQRTSRALQLVDTSGPSDAKQPPQLNSLFHPNKPPQIQSVHQVHNWDWPTNTLGNPLSNPEVTLIGLSATVGQPLFPPFSDHNIGDNVPTDPPPDPFQVYVVYADTNRITLKYDRNDSAATGYVLHIENICTDPNLIALYSTKRYNTISNRISLIALRSRDSFGTARTNEVLVATRVAGSFLDPRTRKNWWRGY